MGQFSLDIAKFVEKTQARADEACRAVGLSLLTKIVLRSPVGNPELWAANAQAALQRSQHNDAVDQINGYLAQDPANLGPKGGLKRSLKRSKRLSRAQLAKAYPNRAGAGYVGGRFRANWFVTTGAASAATTENVDPSGSQAIANASAALASFSAGPSIFLTNNLPYAMPLELGHSKQAPAGMVRITVEEFPQIVAQVVGEVAQ